MRRTKTEKITAITTEKVKALFEEGLNLQQIADKFNCSTTTVRHRYVPPGGTRPKRKSDTLTVEIIEKLAKQGKTLNEIAKIYECSYSTVRKRIRDANAKIKYGDTDFIKRYNNPLRKHKEEMEKKGLIKKKCTLCGKKIVQPLKEHVILSRLCYDCWKYGEERWD